ncbi:MAG: hypothetical protein EXR01_03665 [Acetobacteraceae bacterium]|nr:hypothetical protein [Acetobacteraceae bacterium]
MPTEQLRSLSGCDPDVAKNREQGRQIMRGLGYGLERRIKVKMMTRYIPLYRAPTVIPPDQPREVFIESNLDVVDPITYFPPRHAADIYHRVEFTNQSVGSRYDPALILCL